MKVVVSGQQLVAWRNQAQQAAIAAKIDPQEVDWLLQQISDLDRLSLYSGLLNQRSQILLNYSLSDLSQLWQQRLERRCPIQYLVGVTPWRDFSLKVSPSVLIPRPETEYLIDLALKAVQENDLLDLASGYWVDLGTGSGAIAIGLAKALTKAPIYAVDTSEAALAIAQENVNNAGLSDRIVLCQGSWWTPLEALKGQISGMVSNPPYIPTAQIASLQPEVTQHEPHLALDGGKDGLCYIRHLVQTGSIYLRPGGVWLIEMMAEQGERVTQLLEEQGEYKKIQIIPDFAGYDRYALAYRKGEGMREGGEEGMRG